jgi:predicted MFS family arabinose efflux permease
VTLPVSLFGVELALGTLPAAFLIRAWGRRSAYVFAATIGVAAGLIAAFGIFLTSFAIFCIGSFTAGLYGSYIQSYRFAAADAAESALKARAISWVMVGGLVAAVVGPQLVIWTRDALTQAPYAGSFLSQAALALLSVPVLLMLRASESGGQIASESSGRSLLQMLGTPSYLLAVAPGVVMV